MRITNVAMVIMAVVGGLFVKAANAVPAPEFEFRQFTVTVQQADGRPAAGVSIYGWCPDLNLIWPRRSNEFEGRNDMIWHEAYLGRTRADGSVAVVVPPGKWGFLAAGKISNGALAVWSDFRERNVGEVIRLTPSTKKQWALSALEERLAPKRVFVRPDLFPVWIPVVVGNSTNGVQLEMGKGRMQVWADGDGSPQQTGFSLNMGVVDENTPNGQLTATGALAMVKTQGGGGQAVFLWSHTREFGIQGDLKCGTTARFLFTPGAYTLGYRRPICSGVLGEFGGHFYKLDPTRALDLHFDGALTSALDQELSPPGDTGARMLFARLYFIDTNDHLLCELLNSGSQPVMFSGTVNLNGRVYRIDHGSKKTVGSSHGEPGSTFFEANVGNASSAEGAVWKIDAPSELLPTNQLQQSQMVEVRSQSYRVKVPAVIAPHLRNILDQAEDLLPEIESISGRKRVHSVTDIKTRPGHVGASAAFGGQTIKFGTCLFLSDDITCRHDWVHEVGHNLKFEHGGLHETVVELTRCIGRPQISQQEAKWMFYDRMNGVRSKEVLYQNAGLYLCCYAMAGKPFLEFMLKNDKPLTDKLSAAGFTDGEVTAALVGLAMNRDMNPVCAAYGMKITPERVEAAQDAARPMIVK